MTEQKTSWWNFSSNTQDTTTWINDGAYVASGGQEIFKQEGNPCSLDSEPDAVHAEEKEGDAWGTHRADTGLKIEASTPDRWSRRRAGQNPRRQRKQLAEKNGTCEAPARGDWGEERETLARGPETRSKRVRVGSNAWRQDREGKRRIWHSKQSVNTGFSVGSRPVLSKKTGWEWKSFGGIRSLGSRTQQLRSGASSKPQENSPSPRTEQTSAHEGKRKLKSRCYEE
jgi:hypothetical protein